MEVEWLILSDGAEVANNKLFLLGGGWDALMINSGFPVQHHCAVSAAVRVDWNETNQRHALILEIRDGDGQKQLGKVEAQFEVGRPPGIRLGQIQRIMLAANMTLKIDEPGEYVVMASLDGHEERRTVFNVIPGPALAAKNPPAAA